MDDDPDIRAVLTDILQEEGFPVVAASNGLEALERLAQMARPCLILLDTVMPVMDGAKFLTHLRADPELRACRVVLLTPPGGARPPGVDEVFDSPYELAELFELVKRWSPHD